MMQETIPDQSPHHASFDDPVTQEKITLGAPERDFAEFFFTFLKKALIREVVFSRADLRFFESIAE